MCDEYERHRSKISKGLQQKQDEHAKNFMKRWNEKNDNKWINEIVALVVPGHGIDLEKLEIIIKAIRKEAKQEQREACWEAIKKADFSTNIVGIAEIVQAILNAGVEGKEKGCTCQVTDDNRRWANPQCPVHAGVEDEKA